MSAHTQKPPTDQRHFVVSCPPALANEARQYLEGMGCVVSDAADAREVFPDRSPGTLLSGARYREDMTQTQLSQTTGIPRRHISEMENGRRPIGKANARKLGQALGVDYRYFL